MKFYCRVVSCLLVVFLLISSLAMQATRAEEKDGIFIDPVFLEDVKHSSREEIVIISLKGKDAVSYSSLQSIVLNTPNSYSSHLELDLSYVDTLEDYQNSLVASMQKQIPFTVVHQYQVVLNALAIKIRGYHIPLLSGVPQIESVHSTRDLATPDRKIAARSIHAATTWKMREPLKNADIQGQGITVGIIDSGIDYYNVEFNRGEVTRPSNRDDYAFVPTDKILGGYDFADENNDFFDDFYTPHGTHVAGISSGKHPSNPNFWGMAPESNLYGYKVFSSKAGATGANPANVIKAIDQSVRDKCHVINLSLGNSSPVSSTDESNPYYRSTKRAVEAGVVVVASAGNNGSRHKDTANTLSSPGTFEPVIQVAASADRTIQNLKIVRGDNQVTSIQAIHGLHTPAFEPHHSGVEVVDCGFGSKDELRRVNVRGKIALIARGPRDAGISFFDKNLNAKEAGAVGTIVYNYSNERDRMMPTLVAEYVEDPSTLGFIPFLFINYINADLIKNHVIKGNGRLEFTRHSNVTASDFTSVGPCYSADDNIFKPEITAPGKQIRSTVVLRQPQSNSFSPMYADQDGTSMSAPVVTGGVALIRQARPDWKPEEIKAIIMNTSDLLYNPMTDEILSYFYQGAGQLNVASAIDSPVIVQPPSLMRNIVDQGKNISFSIRNVYKDSVNISFRAEVFNLGEKENPLNFTFSSPSITVSPRQNGNINVSFSTNKDLFVERKYEGAIWFEIDQLRRMNIHTETIRVPFIIYQDSLDKIDDPITHFSISNPEICKDSMNESTVSFRLNAGSLLAISGEHNEINYQNYAYQLSVYAVDGAGEIWGEIFQGENLLVGNYSFIWNGNDVYGNEFLPDGDFFIQVVVSGTEYRVSQGPAEITQKPYRATPIPVFIQGSSIPQPPVMAFSSPEKVRVDQEFKMELVFADLHDINDLDISFNVSNRLEILEIIPGNFIDFSKFDQNKNLSERRGTVTLKASRNPEIENHRITVLSLRLRARRRGDASTLVNQVLLSDDQKTTRKALISIKPIEILDQHFVLGDFNEDGIVDKSDFEMLAQVFMIDFKSPLWDDRFDLNNDLIIDASDLVLFAKYFNQTS